MFLFSLSYINNSKDIELKSHSQFTDISKIRLKTVHGDIVIKLYMEIAPNTCERIKFLVHSGFYNGLSFHRVEPGFIIQTGDPLGTGNGGSGKKLKSEISDLKHTKGIVAMARYAHDLNSADSQFYITLNTFPHLDSKYTIFGEVNEGIEIAEKIVKGDKIITANIE